MKTATKWITRSGYDSVTSISESDLLLETSDILLLEIGDYILLETTVVTTKESTLWGEVAKNPARWSSQDGSTTFSPVTASTRTTAQGDIRVTSTGDTRVTGNVLATIKAPTVWNE